MRKLLCLFLLSALTSQIAMAAGQFSNFINHERLADKTFGNLMVYNPMGPYKNLVLFSSGDYGWTSPSSDMARALAEEGSLVIGLLRAVPNQEPLL